MKAALRHIAPLILLLSLLLATAPATQGVLTCQIRRFGHARPTCMCRENGRWRAWPMIACQLTQSRGM
jgi:hypothetical protein